MSKESKDIRAIITDIDMIINESKINESFAFGEKMPSQKPISSPTQTQLPKEDVEPGLNLDTEIETNPSGGGIDESIKQIRQLSVKALMDLDPTDDPDSYKMIKGIWDSCDKYLLKDNVAKPKEQPANNI